MPATVQAFSGAVLDAKGVSDLKDLQLVTPGLQYDSMASYSIIYIRGIGGDAYQAGIDSSVATYVDDLYLPFTFGAAQALGDVAQVEVLKGPQGTLYGRNAIAGAITVKLKEPTKEFTSSVLLQGGSQEAVKGKLSVSGPIPFTKFGGDEERLSYTASVLYENRESFSIFYPDPSQKYHDYRNFGYRGLIKAKLFGETTLSVSALGLKFQDSDSVVTVLLEPFTPFKPILTGRQVPHESGISTFSYAIGKTRLATAKLESNDIPYFNAKFIAGRGDSKSDILFDYDGAPEPVLDISAVPNTLKAKSYELILTSNPENTPDWLEYIGGLFYSDTFKSGFYPVTVDGIALALGTPGSALGLPLCPVLSNFGLDCTANPDINTNPLVQARLGSGFNNKARSAYGQLTFHVTEKLSAVAGARASVETAKLLFSTIDARVIVPLPGPGGGFETPQIRALQFNQQSHVFSSFTPNVGLNYKLFDSTLVYYKYSEAFKSGNYNGLNANKPPTRVEPELASGNEIGVKSTGLLESGALTTNASIFTTTITNAQVQTLSLLAGGVTSLQNAGAYTVRGAELEANWNVTDSLVVGGSLVYLDGKYDNFIGRQIDPSISLNRENIDFTGNTTVRTPKYTGTGQISYSFPFFFGLDAEAAMDAYYTSGYFFDPLNTQKQPEYYILNARFSVFDPRTNIRLTAFGKNITDEVFFSQQFYQDFGTVGYYGAGALYGLTLNWSYGN